MHQPRIVRTFFVTGIVLTLLLAVVWYALGRSAFEKIATALAQPCGVLWYVFLCTAIICLRHAERKTAMLTTFGFVMYTAMGNGFVSETLTRTLESDYYAVNPLEEAPFDVVIVLGGGASVSANGRIQGNSSGDRLILTAQLYHAGLAPQIICTGARIASMDSIVIPVSERSADVLIKLGVPESAILKIGGETTSAEMKAIKKQFGDRQPRVGLVTSAWHLPRAMKLANRNGLKSTPLPADFQSSPGPDRTVGEKINMCIPQAGAFQAIAQMAKEYMGMAVGR